jgi:hypothetical protein
VAVGGRGVRVGGRRVGVAVAGRLVGTGVDVGVCVAAMVGVSVGTSVGVGVGVSSGVGVVVSVGTGEGLGVLVGVGVTVGEGAMSDVSGHVQLMVIIAASVAARIANLCPVDHPSVRPALLLSMRSFLR